MNRYSKHYFTNNDFQLIFAGSVFIPKSWCCWWGNPYGWGNFSCCPISSWYVSAHFLLDDCMVWSPFEFSMYWSFGGGESLLLPHRIIQCGYFDIFFCLTITLHGLLFISYSKIQLPYFILGWGIVWDFILIDHPK